MHVLELRMSNFKRIKAAIIRPDPNNPLVIVRGRNAQGKSSVIDAIWTALGGKACAPDDPIRHGETRAEIALDMGDYTVQRSFTEANSYLTVKTREGAAITRPQELLDRLVGAISFDPLLFTRMKPREQVDQLTKITGVNFSELNAQRATAFNERTVANKVVQRLKAKQGEISKTIPAGLNANDYAKKKDPSSVLAEMQQQEAKRTEISRAQFAFDALTASVDAKRAEIEQIEAELRAAKERLNDLEMKREQTLKLWEEKTAGMPDNPALDYNSMLAQINSHNILCDSFVALGLADSDIERAEAESRRLTAKIEEIDARKADIIASKQMPVAGLSFDEDGVYFNDVPLAQASSSEQLRVGTAIAMKMNPTIKVIRIADGSLLDADSMKELMEMAAASDYQVWVERVDDSESGPGLLIEDGEVRSVGDTPTGQR